MNYLLCLLVPPAAVWISGNRLQAGISLVLWVVALSLFNWATSNGPPGAYAAGPVVYIFTIIHAFVLTHRHMQEQTGDRHPHRKER
ncbi:YqaE/Pmp3 family membrane protein [Aliidiomarina celeris]|uniref:YqaE/Pmp3 family membrane protein n=1 Tax=Aliidiomarina celeris TaxID=2249428 RepID=UPI001300B76E|nr:YqaE/Pmp3 family membrane protein [Aliidiomarina celeris]